MEGAGEDRVIVENINHPGRSVRLDRTRYEAMRLALLAALPSTEPGMTQSEMSSAVKQHLDEDVFPRPEKAGWWSKAVQLDLEAKA